MTTPARSLPIALIVLALFGGPRPTTALAADRASGPAASSRLLVQTKAGADATEVVAEAGRRSRSAPIRLRRVHGANVHVLEVGGDHLEAIEAALAGDRRVRFVERDQVVPPAQVTGDVYAPPGYHLPLIGASWAWRVTTGSADAPIAILDSGIDATHPDLADRVLPGWNVYDGNDDTRDIVGHGTLVAGVLAAARNDAAGLSGVIHATPILPVRVTDEDGNAYHSTLTEGLVWAADHGARVANISFAVFGGHALSSAAQYFVNRGGLIFAAGGNDGTRHDEDANDWIVSVAATGPDDIRAEFSSSGPYIDLAAPGVELMSTTVGGGYAHVSGTSVASPVAAGAAALAWSANPSLTAGQVEDLLKGYSEDLGAPGYDPFFGWGRVDAARTVAVAIWLGRTVDRIGPSSRIVSPAGGQIVRDAVSVTVEATDNVAVVGVELLVDGQRLAISETEPHTFIWDSSTALDGAHRLVARARDAAGNVGTSVPLTVTVDNTHKLRPPRVRLRVPSAPLGSSGITPVAVHARGDERITVIEVYVDSKLAMAEHGNALRSTRFDWNTIGLADGPHTIFAVARDAAGNAGSSKPVSLQVRNGG